MVALVVPELSDVLPRRVRSCQGWPGASLQSPALPNAVSFQPPGGSITGPSPIPRHWGSGCGWPACGASWAARRSPLSSSHWNSAQLCKRLVLAGAPSVSGSSACENITKMPRAPGATAAAGWRETLRDPSGSLRLQARPGLPAGSSF